MQFTIKKLESDRLIAGISNQHYEIKYVWELLHKYAANIPNATYQFPNGESFGICCRVEGDSAANHFTYLAGVPVSDVNGIPLPFFGQVIPAGMYAVFDCPDIESISKTYNHIYETWFPQSGLSQTAFFDFEKYDLTDGVETIEIWVPVTVDHY